MMRNTAIFTAASVLLACGEGSDPGQRMSRIQQQSDRHDTLAADSVPPNPLCTIGAAWDPQVGRPSSAALAQLSPSGTKLRVGLATTNRHYAFVVNGVPVGPGIDVSCRLGAMLNLPVEFKFYSTLPDLLTGFRANPPEFEIGWAFDPSLADADLALTNPYVAVPNTYAVAKSSPFLVVADVDVPRDPQVKVGTAIGNSPAVYLARNLKFAKLLTFPGMGAQTALLAGTIDAVASARTGLTDFANQNSTKVRVLPDDIFYANLAPFMHFTDQEGLCYLNDFLEAAKASGLVLEALSRTTPSVLAGGSKLADPMPICPPTAKCHDVTVPADDSCRGSGSINAGSSDDDGDADCIQSPAGPYALGTTHVTLTCTDHASLGSSSCAATVTVVDTTPPAIICPNDQTLECNGEGGVATFAPTVTDNCGVASVQCSPASGTKFPEDPSPALAACIAIDTSGNKASCAFHVRVQDTLPPVVTTNPGDENGFIASLWPPDHSYRTVSLADCIEASVDLCDGTAVTSAIVGVTSDEAAGRGKKGDDIAIAPDGASVQLRAERDGSGDGRVYTIFAVSSDDDGNVSRASCKVQVPHDESGAAAVDSGVAYCVGTCRDK